MSGVNKFRSSPCCQEIVRSGGQGWVPQTNSSAGDQPGVPGAGAGSHCEPGVVENVVGKVVGKIVEKFVGIVEKVVVEVVAEVDYFK